MTPELTASLIVHTDYTHIASALHSLYQTTIIPVRVILTANTGQDANLARIREEFPDVEIVINEHPRGFATNHNAVLHCAETDFVALLNDDIILHNGALDILVSYLKDHPDVGLVGPALQNPDGSPQVSAYSDPSLLRTIYKVSGLASLTHQQSWARRWLQGMGVLRLLNVESLRANNETRSVPVVKGTVMVVRREAYEQAGVMDEATLAYGEEYGWHLRLRQAGWKVVLVTDAHVTHFGLGQARLELKGHLLIEDRKAILHYFLKYRSKWQSLLLRCAIILSHSFYALVWLAFDRERVKTHLNVVHMALKYQLPMFSF